jgi:hypothetical protein
MKILGVACAVLLLTSPALADINYTPLAETYDFGVGLYNPADPGTLNDVYVDPAYLSDTFVFTWAIHCADIYYNAERIHFTFGYDNSSIEVVHMSPLGGWEWSSYENILWPTSVPGGWIEVDSLSQGFDVTTNYEPYDTTAIVPFMQVTLHVKSDTPSQVNMFGVVAMSLISHSYALTLTPASFVYGMGAIHEMPEPSSLMLLGGALAAMAGGFIRRGRR